jgi:hypothetical protein
MSPSGKPEDLLTIDWEKTQSTGGYSDDNETNYEWEDTLCILLDSGNFVSIDTNKPDVKLRKMDSIFGPKLDEGQTFFRMRVGMKPGTMWCKIFEWESDDYKYVMDNDYIMDRLENNITPNPPYISEMKTNYRELQIDKIL